MSGIETILALVGLGGATGAGAGAGAGGMSMAVPAAAGAAASMGETGAVGSIPLAGEGGGGGAGKGAGGGLLGKMTQNVTGKDAIELMKIASQMRTPSTPMSFPTPSAGGGQRGGPSVAQFLSFLQSRQKPQLGGGM